MRHRSITVLLALGLVASFTWIGLRFEFRSSDSRSAEGAPPMKVPPVSGRDSALPVSVENSAAPPIEQAANASAIEEALVSDLSTQLYGHFNDPFVQFLVGRGLSRQDGERVIGEAFHEAAICWLMAVRAQSEAEGRSFDPKFEREHGALADARALGQLEAACINSALGHVGVNPPAGIRANDA